MLDVVVDFFKNGFNFSGRCDRSTFFLTIIWFVLLGLLLQLGLTAIDDFLGNDKPIITYVVFIILGLVCLIPSITMEVRRLHDINKSGLWILISLVPGIGEIILLVLLCLPSVYEGNNY